MKTSGRCIVAIETKNGEFYQVALDENGEAVILSLLNQYFDNKIKVIRGKMPFRLERIKPSTL